MPSQDDTVWGWLICRYIRNGSCTAGKSVFAFRTVQGVTTKLDRQTKLHTARSTSSFCFMRLLPRSAKNSTAKSAGLAVAPDLCPVWFGDGHKRNERLRQISVWVGRTACIHENEDPWSYLPEKTSVSTAVNELAHLLGSQFIRKRQMGAWKTVEVYLSMECIWKHIENNTTSECIRCAWRTRDRMKNRNFKY